MASWSVFRGFRLRELDKKRPVGGVLPGLSFTLDPAEMEDLARSFRNFPGAVQAAIQAATDRTRQFARNQLVRQYRDLLTLKPAYISRGVKSRKARLVNGGAEAEVRIATRNIPLGRYEVRPERPPQLKGVPVAARKRVTYRLRKGGRIFGDSPRNEDAPASASRTFVQGMASGHIGVFYRTDRGTRGTLVQDYAPSLQYHAYADGFIKNASRLTAARFRETFTHEASRITGVSA